ncbi:SIS domain-containing protein [Micromonospora sp. DR5-3]|uniref:SIS domain-containing protein n=1 Tax=unclassified Micromonospora TaxID=2617518 RepID=UPI0011D7E8A6|nr:MULTISPECIES: SIS domain-containing protein [unclassified Micromonospora]MCW3818142.1 SIS domain-containing protein [Micromonospora sp. DR5-3]TYC21802.1 SIS domain-containing protein [Micromonospora sp. MP36]
MDPRLFLADLEAKPESLRRLAATLADGDAWHGLPDRVERVLLLGMGSSRYAADMAALRLRAVGVDAVAEYASAATGCPPGPRTVVVAISATGTSQETLDAAGRYQGAGPLVALTNMPDSPLANLADLVVPMHAGVEAGGVACRTFQHTLVLLLDLVARLTAQKDVAGLARRDVVDLARRAADATEDLLTRRDEWLPTAAALLDGPHGIYTLAPVERLSSAMQSALMVREGPRRPADGCETGDWSHVDVYLTKTLDYRALLFPGSRYDAPALDWLRQREATVLAVGAEVAGAAAAIRYRGDDEPGVRLLTETLVAELVAARWWVGS